ncbi:conjugal transfer protein TraD [Paraburkholderia madseniana]|uniref:conjugal transfer protein TraD n=1 Tax=Paraburkholderia madseniana TaxID=2599607 RepID=UPI001C12ECD4|nr:conjugal transfer protein TraD [Paraburkholderia madseniana]
MMAKAEWLTEHVQYIKGLKSPTATQSLLVELAAIPNPTAQESRQLDKLVRLEKINQKADAMKAEAARMLSARREDQRKARTRELIELGGIVSMVDFPVDRGTLTGALLWALDQFRTDDDLQHTLKKRGDAFIAERENEKKAESQASAEVAAKAAAAEKVPA